MLCTLFDSCIITFSTAHKLEGRVETHLSLLQLYDSFRYLINSKREDLKQYVDPAVVGANYGSAQYRLLSSSPFKRVC